MFLPQDEKSPISFKTGLLLSCYQQPLFISHQAPALHEGTTEC